MLSINTNLSSMITQSSMKSSTNKLNEAVERMSTGYRINHAKDNAANYSISTNMTTKLSAYDVAADNVAMGMDLVGTASDIISQMQEKGERLRALAIQARNSTYGGLSLNAINAEANALINEITRLYISSEYNGIDLFTRKKLEMADFISQAKAEYNGFINNPEDYQKSYVDNLTALSKEEDSFTENIYKIAEVKDLVKLAELTNAGVDTTGKTFILAGDLDLSEYCEEHKDEGGWTPIGNDVSPFKGTFNGNGHTISNLTINRAGNLYQGLFGNTKGRNLYLKNVGIINANVKGGGRTGGLVGMAQNKIENVYVTGKVKGNVASGGIVGILSDGALNNSYSIADVSGYSVIGGLIGENYVSISNCYATGSVNGERYVGGLIGRIFNTNWTTNISSCASYGLVKGQDSEKTGSFIGGFLISPVDGSSFGTINITNSEVASNGTNFLGLIMNSAGSLVDYDNSAMLAGINEAKLISVPTILQVGINSDDSCQIEFDTNFDFDLSEVIFDIASDNSLQTIDNFINILSEKSTKLGSIENRLNSALDSIAVNIENLTSSRSTIRDADMAELSSQYIQQQILQEASATLMAVANQSPAIALQLI